MDHELAAALQTSDSKYLYSDHAAGIVLRTVDILQLHHPRSTISPSSTSPRRRNSITKLIFGDKDSDSYQGTYGGYWIVKDSTLETATVSCGVMDSTSVVSFKYSDQSKRDPLTASKELKEIFGDELVQFNKPLHIFTNFGSGGRFLGLGGRTGNFSKGE